MTEATVSRRESGDIDNMRRDKIASLAEVLKVSPLLIMGDEKINRSNMPPTAEELKLLDGWRELGIDDKNFMWQMIKRLHLPDTSPKKSPRPSARRSQPATYIT